MASVISAGTTSNTSLNLSGDTSGVLQLASNGSTTAVTINTSQQVGIGTASPAYKLDVTGSGSTTCQIERTDGTYVLALKGSGTSSVGALGMATNDMVMLTNSAERMRLTSGGDLCIGTTSIGNTTSGSNVRFGKDGIGAMASVFQAAVANNGTVDIDVGGGGAGSMCILEASNSNAGNATVATRKIFAVMGRGTTFTFTEIGTQNGTSGGFGFSMSCPSNGRLRLTNTAGSNGDVVLTLFGTAAY
jgi:hypothetical protein